MIKVAYTIGTLLTGGAEVFVVNLIKNLDIRKFKVILIVLDKKNNTFLEKEIEKYNIEVVYMNKPNRLSFKTMIKVYKVLKSFRPNVIHGNIGGIIYILLYLIFNRKVKAVHTCHTLAKMEFNKLKRIILKYFYLKRRIIPVVISNMNLEEFMKTYKISKDYIKVIVNGIDINRFLTTKDFNHSLIRLGHVGRFEKVKNHELICNIYESLVTQNIRVSLLLVGKGSLLNFYKQRLKKHNVKFVEETSTVEEELKKIDIFIFPSIYEGMPLSLIEAMASGCVILASDVGGIKELIEDDVNGYKFNYKDLEGFVNKCIKLISNPNKLKHISNNNIKKAKIFSIEKMVEGYTNLYLKEANIC